MKKILVFLLLLSLLAVPVSARNSPIELRTAQDLLAIADDPYGSYILMADIDMAGVEWPCPAFFGTLDGNGHTILNLSITRTGTEAVTARDGNFKAYDCQVAGLFSYMNSATVKNLTLLGLNGKVTSDQPCFLAGIAGAAFDATVENCSVQGSLELRAHKGMFGMAGLVGYGSGEAKKCSVDVTLVCVDTDSETKDEQFLGGILGNGFMDIKSCDVQLDAYISEFGYVHSGGIVGMYYQKPFDSKASHHGKVIYNTVSGKITFFECNADRRAYCKAVVGEPVAERWGEDHNKTEGFVRDERKEYDRELRPEMCQQPQYSEQLQAASCHSFGYTEFTCAGCGYSYRDAYTRKAHDFGPWQVVTQATAQAEGVSRAVCGNCAVEITRVDVYIPPETTPVPTSQTTQPTPAPTAPQISEPDSNEALPWILLLAGLALVAVGLLLYAGYRRRQQRKRRRQRRRPNFQ